MTSPPAKTFTQAYKARLFAGQSRIGKLRSELVAMVVTTGVLTAMAIGMGAFVLWARVNLEFMQTMSQSMFGFLALIIIVFLVANLVFLVKNAALAFRAVRTVTCPDCSVSHTLFRRYTDYVCGTCDLRLVPGDDDRLVAVTCPGCDQRTAVTAEHGELTCASCGAATHAAGGALRFAADAVPCPSCGADTSAQQHHCGRCHARLPAATDPPFVIELAAFLYPGAGYGDALRSDLNPSGKLSTNEAAVVEHHLRLGTRGTLWNARERVRMIAAALDPADPDTLQGYLLTHPLELACLQLGEVLHQEPALASEVSATLRDADRVHAVFLEGLVARLRGDPVLGIDQIDLVASTYLPQRRLVIDSLAGSTPDHAKGFAPLTLDGFTYTRMSDGRNGEIKDPKAFVDVAAALRGA